MKLNKLLNFFSIVCDNNGKTQFVIFKDCVLMRINFSILNHEKNMPKKLYNRSTNNSWNKNVTGNFLEYLL